MELVPVGKIFDFMRHHRLLVVVSTLAVLGSLALLIFAGPKLGTDFRGGTEVEVAFEKAVAPEQIRQAVTSVGFSTPDVIHVADDHFPYRYMIRVKEVSVIDEATQAAVDRALCFGDKLPAEACPKERLSTEVKFSPGGDKVTVRFEAAPDLDWIRAQMSTIPGVKPRAGDSNPTIQNERNHRVEIQLMSKGDQLMAALSAKLGSDVAPEHPLRVEWIGPKAGAQLRDAALKSIAIALVFIMAYIAVRFDLRFAPGAVLALFHDATLTVGVLILLGKELNLTTVAAVLTIIGYSVNDTVVVYDRVRENLGKLRGSTFMHLINVSLSEMLSRTLLTSGTTIVSLVAFFYWGTGTLEDFSLTLIIGLVLGTYSSIYVALPLTEWLDRRFFGHLKQSARGKRSGRSTARQPA